jgi:hypothetical protein
MFINRKSSGAELVRFAFDNATIGNIGSKLANSQYRLYLGNSNTKILFDNGADRIYPVNNDGNARNGAIDLGLQGAAFKDLYLTGGIQFDSRSNKLDDYEEGTWDPRIEGYSGSDVGTTQTYSQQAGYYTRIGNMVYATFTVRLSSKGNIGGNYSIIRGFPFNHAGSTAGSFIMNYFWSLNSSASFVGAELGGSAASSCWLTKISGTGQAGSTYMDTNTLTNSSGFQGTIVYRTA